MNWKIEFDKKAKDEFFDLETAEKKRIIKFIEERLAKTENPRKLGAPLRGHLSGLWKYRIGNYRLICQIEDSVVTILIISVGHRKDVYKIS